MIAATALMAAPARCATVTTGDRLALDFREGDAAITGVRVGDRALPLNGTYTVRVSKLGFGNEEVNGIALRAGETAPATVHLLDVRVRCRTTRQ